MFGGRISECRILTGLLTVIGVRLLVNKVFLLLPVMVSSMDLEASFFMVITGENFLQGDYTGNG